MAGEIVGMVGESGCGKSTAALSFMRLIPRPGRITGGEILLDGLDILKLSDKEMRNLRGPGGHDFSGCADRARSDHAGR